MTSEPDQQPYVLSYRRDNVEEDKRLNSQHEVIKHGILDGHLIHPSVGALSASSAIADLGCGTGIWLEDVANTFFTDESSATLIGFDTNAHAFNANPAQGVQLVVHDCTVPFHPIYVGRFDLVNIRGLACALSEGSFARLIANAILLLKPGGYLQWLETEPRLWTVYPKTAEIAEALEAIEHERQDRDLVPYLPHFMLRQLLSLNPGSVTPGEDVMTIINFNLLPGGIGRESQPPRSTLNEHFSDVVLESVKLLLNASLVRKKSLPVAEGAEDGIDHSELMKLQRLMDFVEGARKSDKVTMGGLYPQLIARKLQGPLV